MKKEELKEFQELFGNNFIGPEQVNQLLAAMSLPNVTEEDIPEMNYPMDVLKSKACDYLLVMGYSGREDAPINIIKFRDIKNALINDDFAAFSGFCSSPRISPSGS